MAEQKNRVTFTGTENLRRIFREFPEGGYRKPVMAAFRKAAVPVQKAMKNNLPAKLKGAARSIRIVPYKGKDPELGVGVFRKGMMYQNRRGQNWNPWMLIYWHNYGTLANRDSQHSFSNPRRNPSAGWKGGIKPGRFIDKAWESSKGQAQQVFEENAEKEIDKFFKERAAR